jgi:hypothetical protein
MTCTLSHEPYHPVMQTFHIIGPSKGTNWPLLSWSIGNWMSDYMCNQCLSPLTLWAWIPFMEDVLDTILYDTFSQWIATGQWSSPSTPVSPNNKTDRQDITEIPLKEKVEDTNGVIRSCKSKQDGQMSLKTLTHSPKRQSEIIDIALVKYSRCLNLLYYKDLLC